MDCKIGAHKLKRIGLSLEHRLRRSVLDPFKPRITRLLDTHPCSAQQIFQRLREEGYGGGMTILRDYLRRIRPTEQPVYPKLHSAASQMRTVLSCDAVTMRDPGRDCCG